MTHRLAGRSLAILAVLGGCAGDIGTGATGLDDPAEGSAGSARPPRTGTAPETSAMMPTSGASGQTPPPAGQTAVLPPPPASCTTREPPPTRIWKLTPDQYTRTVQQLLGQGGAFRPGDELAATLSKKAGFSNEAGVPEMAEPHVNQLFTTARGLAATVAGDPQVFSCQSADAACLRGFAGGFGQRAFRRPLVPAELDGYTAFLQKHAAASGPRTAARLFVTAVLMSPHFLYRTELGPEGAKPGAPVALTAHEKASALSYFLTDGPPDPMLTDAAGRGALETRAQLEAHARRLLSGRASSAGVLKLFSEHFALDGVLGVEKDARTFSAWRPTLAADLAREPELFVEQVLWREDAKLGTLLTAPFSVLNARLAAHYGIKTNVPTEFAKTMLPPGRAGLLMQGGLMAYLARDNDTDPVKRGLFLREHVLCSPPPPPPPTINIIPPPPDGMRTQRQRLGQHSADPTCSPCHALLDPPGLAFEIFDGIGRQRDTDVGQPIDTAGVLTSARSDGARFRDAGELVGILARSPDTAACMVKKSFEYAHGRAPTAQDACALASVAARFGASGGNLLELMLAIVTEDTFAIRRQP